MASASNALRILGDIVSKGVVPSPYGEDGFKYDQRVKDAHGHRLVDDTREPDDVLELFDWGLTTLGKRGDAFAEAIHGEPLKAVSIPKKSVTDWSCFDGLSDMEIYLLDLGDIEAERWASRDQSVNEETRLIVVPSVRRRIVSRVISDILAQTSTPRLTRASAAYVPGRGDVVRTALRGIGRSVKRGWHYVAELDIKSCFPSIPWKLLKEGLSSFGYPSEFVEMVVAMAKTPLVEFDPKSGTWHQRPNHAGTQAGLAESGIILNILLDPLDRLVLQRYGSQVYYVRYADNFILGSWNKEALSGAVRLIRGWIEKHGLRLKNVSPGQRPETIIRDLHDGRVELLGAEIDRAGEVHVPEHRVDEQLKKIAFYRSKYMTARGSVVGESKYQGRSVRPIDFLDQEDIGRLIESFYSYWSGLNVSEAQDFLGRAQEEDSVLILSPAEEFRWIAALGNLPRQTGEAIVESRMPRHLDTDCVEAVASFDPVHGLDFENEEDRLVDGLLGFETGSEIAYVGQEDPWSSPTCTISGSNPSGLVRQYAVPDHESRCSEDTDDDVPGLVDSPPMEDRLPCSGSSSSGSGHLVVQKRENDGDSSFPRYTPLSDLGSGSLLELSDADESLHGSSDVDDMSSPYGSDASPSNERLDCPVDVRRPRAPVDGAPDGDDSPASAVLLEGTTVVYLLVRRLRRQGVTLVGMYVESGQGWRAQVEQERGSALAETFAAIRLVVASLAGAREPTPRGCGRTLVVRLADAEPVKLLVQEGRRIESLGVYEEVEALHREARAARVQVVLVGPCATPVRLATAVDLEVSQLPQTTPGRTRVRA